MQQPEPDRLVNQAAQALGAGRPQQAEAQLDAALRLAPAHPMALTLLAEIALTRKDFAAALPMLDTALAAEPYLAPAWNQRSHACWMAGRPHDALAAARTSVQIQPHNPSFRLNLGQLAAWTGHGAETREVLKPLLEQPHIDPHTKAAAISLLGELAAAEGRFEDAETHLAHAQAAQPGLHSARMMRGMNQLRLGHFKEGWANYAARELVPFLYPQDALTGLPGKPWSGEPLAGKTILVADDQGHGDAIQFFRYLPMLEALGPAHIVLRTFGQLVRLFAEAAPYATVLAALPAGANVDYHCNSTNLPRWFGTELASIPAPGAYLRPPSRVRALMRLPVSRRPKVGLVWSGDPRHMRDHLRSIPAARFLTLADTRGISFHSLQHEVRATDLPALLKRPRIGRPVEAASDLADTAALIAGLDLVIAVDTGVAHLAAAMGKPVWIVLHVAADWRWLADRDDSPWYPTVRLFRVQPDEWADAVARAERRGQEPAPVDAGWTPVLQRVADALRAFTRQDQAAGTIRPSGRPPNR